ncbi:MAG TPA: dipicolinate synthase subunit DpsA [Bacillota bacterium]|nr:dipicolinate synthase subunit DpsA [Bacillota bacterium]
MEFPVIAFIGGDKRMMYACDALIEMGAEVCYCGFENYEGDATKCRSAVDAVVQSSVCVFPINYPLHEIEALMQLNPNALYAGGLVSGKLEGIYDYLSDEKLTTLNAIPTAEGALMIAIRETHSTVKDAKVLVLGYGRVGKAVSRLFCAAGAKVSVAARNKRDLATCEIYGCRPCEIEMLGSYIGEADIIINTVPAHVADAKVLDRVSCESLIIDLASKPGGIDFEYAKNAGLRVIWALSLPSAVAPKTSGTLIAGSIVSFIERQCK